MSVSGLWYAGVFFPLRIFELGWFDLTVVFVPLYTIPQQSPVASRGFLPCPVVSRLATLHASTPAILILDNQIDLPRFSFLSVCKPTLPAPKAFNFFLPFSLFFFFSRLFFLDLLFLPLLSFGTVFSALQSRIPSSLNKIHSTYIIDTRSPDPAIDIITATVAALPRALKNVHFNQNCDRSPG